MQRLSSTIFDKYHYCEQKITLTYIYNLIGKLISHKNPTFSPKFDQCIKIIILPLLFVVLISLNCS